MSWLKVGLQLTALTTYSLSVANPNPSAKKELETASFEKPRFDDLAIRTLVPLSNVAIFLPVLAETALALAHTFPASPYSPRILTILGASPALLRAASTWPSTQLIVGTFLTSLASLGRIWCFRTLGKHFTFNIGLLPEHALVTSGPYSWVRHPSYTAMMLGILGAILTLGAPGGWLRDASASADKPWLMGVRVGIALAWGLAAAGGMRVMLKRTRIEDEFLRGHFGKEWDAYAEQVRYKLVPGLI